MFCQYIPLQVLLATLPYGTVIQFATFQIVVGDMPGKFAKNLICVNRFFDRATICFTAGGDEGSAVLASTGDWSTFFSGEQVYSMLSQNLKAEDGPPKDTMIAPLVDAISQLSLSGSISQEFRYGLDCTCQWKLSQTSGKDERKICFTLIHQPPGKEEVRRGVSFLITYPEDKPQVRLELSGKLVNLATGPQPPMLTPHQQAELAEVILLLR